MQPISKRTKRVKGRLLTLGRPSKINKSTNWKWRELVNLKLNSNNTNSYQNSCWVVYLTKKKYFPTMPNALDCRFPISSEDSNKCRLNNGFYVDKLQNYFKDYSKQEIHRREKLRADINSAFCCFIEVGYNVKCTQHPKVEKWKVSN